MLLELSIRNFAIIDDLRINFATGFTVLSGETGAGKSILLNAVNLLLGARASAELVRAGADSAELEALFEIPPNSPVLAVLEAQGLDGSEELLIRRIIARRERHRVYINGRLSTLQVLTSLTEHLASITGQHEHQLLLREEQQLLILDHFADAMALRRRVYDCYQTLRPLLQKLQEYTTRREDRSRQDALLRHELDEIQAAEIRPDEDVQLEQELLRLKHAQLLMQTLHDTIESLYSGPGAVAERLVVIATSLSRMGDLDEGLRTAGQQADQIAIQVEELADHLRRYLKHVDLDDARLDDLENRLTQLQKLKRKYGGSLESVLDQQQRLQSAMAELVNLDAAIEALQQKIQVQHQQLAFAALALSAKRQAAAVTLGQRVERQLAELKMPHCIFNVALNTMPTSARTGHLAVNGNTVTETGLEKTCFMVAPNPGETPKSLSGIASGGELSRMLLAVKAIAAGVSGVETIIFDEVDAGIGGAVAEVVGRKVAALAEYHQVLCITHLPQIACFADHHFKISKHLHDGRTVTRIEALDATRRVEEIARMLGGENITETTLAHAREMLGRVQGV